MRSKIALAVVVTALTSLFAVAPAQAKTIKLFVTPHYALVDQCRIVPGQVRFSFEFRATFKRKNSPFPKNVKFNYSVTDSATGGNISTGTVHATKRGHWTVDTPAITLATGASYLYTFHTSFKSPTTGRTIKGSDTLDDQVPTDDQLDQLNPPLPACV